MATELALTDHLAGLAAAVDLLTRWAGDVPRHAPVPTCPGWTVEDLLAHLGMVHRWATAQLLGDEEMARAPEPIEVEGRNQPDQVSWIRQGADALGHALESAADDVTALVFLKDAPPPRQFWARRQCHETTVHAVDVLAAGLHRAPRTEEVPLSEALALDGIDEVLTGFVPRRSQPLRSDEPYTLLVQPRPLQQSGGSEPSVTPRGPGATAAPTPPTHGMPGWLLRVSHDPVVTTRTLGDVGADRVLSGDPVALYLALWNRGDEVEDPSDVLTTWRRQVRITW